MRSPPAASRGSPPPACSRASSRSSARTWCYFRRVPGGLLFVALVFVALRNFHRARSQCLANGDTHQAALATHLGLAFAVLALFMLFLTIPSHKYLWVMLAVASYLNHQASTTESREDAS